jgi:AAA+ ATPase superfamily predicted ATPase
MVDHAKDKEGPSIVTGNIARGSDMWDREAEIDNIWKTLKKDNVLFKACRRFGKSSIMNKMCENPIDSFTCFFFDVESVLGQTEVDISQNQIV